MVDIIPGAVISSVSEDNAVELQSNTGQKEGGSPSDFESVPEIGLQEPLQPNNNRPKMILALIVVIVVVIGGIVIGLNWQNVEWVFYGNGDVDLSRQQQESYTTIDEDRDGLTTLEELAAGTLVSDPDTDKDGMPDGFEVENGLNPVDSTDAADDQDNDELNNADEYIYESKINDPDTDKDGFKDGAEVKNGFNPAGPGELVRKQDDIQDQIPLPVADGLVRIVSENFDPQFIRIKEGESLTFKNEDTISHSVTGPEIETGNILPGDSFTIQFPNEGTFEFFDKDNAKFTGKVLVEKES